MGSSKNGSSSSLRACFSQNFSLAYLGIACVLVWNQCILYNQRISVDAGPSTVWLSLVRCAFMLILLAIALTAWKGQVKHWVESASVGLMAIASAIELAANISGSPLLQVAQIVCAAIGITWGGGMWIQFFVRLPIMRSFAYASASLALSAVVGIVICFVPDTVSATLGIILPVASYACYTTSMRKLDKDPENPKSDELVRTYTASDLRIPRPTKETGRLAAGLLCFSVALGIARGYPAGEALFLPLAFRVLQFVFVIAAMLVFALWFSRPNGNPSAGALWAVNIAVLTVGIFLVASGSVVLIPWGAAVLSAINLIQVLILWLLAYDTGKHSPRPPFMALAFFWFLHLFFRELGRALIIVFPVTDSTMQTVMIAVVVSLLAVSVSLLLAGRTPTGEKFFAEFKQEWEAPAKPEGEPLANPVPASNAVPTAFPQNDGQEAPQQGSHQAESQSLADWLRTTFMLTARECDVALLLAQGKSAAVIGERLYLSKETVRSYTKNIYAKMDVHSKQELADLIEGQKHA